MTKPASTTKFPKLSAPVTPTGIDSQFSLVYHPILTVPLPITTPPQSMTSPVLAAGRPSIKTVEEPAVITVSLYPSCRVSLSLSFAAMGIHPPGVNATVNFLFIRGVLKKRSLSLHIRIRKKLLPFEINEPEPPYYR